MKDTSHICYEVSSLNDDQHNYCHFFWEPVCLDEMLNSLKLKYVAYMITIIHLRAPAHNPADHRVKTHIEAFIKYKMYLHRRLYIFSWTWNLWNWVNSSKSRNTEAAFNMQQFCTYQHKKKKKISRVQSVIEYKAFSCTFCATSEGSII